jgi:hypothetical protein
MLELARSSGFTVGRSPEPSAVRMALDLLANRGQTPISGN